MVWIGASDQDGVWQWSNGSPIGFSLWREGFGNHGDGNYCVRMWRGERWMAFLCTAKQKFICKPDSKANIMKTNKTLIINHTIESNSFSRQQQDTADGNQAKHI